MRIILVHPPQATFFSPYLAAPSLKASLEAAGHQVRIVDLNLQANLLMLDRPWLEEVAGAEGVEVAARTQASLSALRERRTYRDENAILTAFAMLDQAYALSSRAFKPTEISYDLRMRYNPLVRAELEQAVVNEGENPYIRLLRDMFLKELRQDPPDVLGIGLAYETQLIPAFTLAWLVHTEFPDIHVCIGGNMVTKLHRRLVEHQYLPEGVCSAIIHEGETPLNALLDALGRGPDQLQDVPNLLWRSGDRIILNEARSEEDLSLLHTPDFDGMALDDYLLPLRLLPLLSSRGCYWGRCAFCTHRHGYGRFRMRPSDKLVDDIVTLRKRYGTRAFFLADEAVPPRQVRALANAFGDEGTDGGIRWFGDVRFERVMARPEFAQQLWASGCRLLAFGLESASPRVLNLMDKGGSPQLFAEVLRACSAVGIHTITMFFSGFPGETLPEAHETMRFIQVNQEHIGGWANTAFSLQGGSAVQLNPESFGVTSIRQPEGLDLSENYEYDVIRGLTSNSAAQISDAIRRRRESDPKYAGTLPRELIFAKKVLEES